MHPLAQEATALFESAGQAAGRSAEARLQEAFAQLRDRLADPELGGSLEELWVRVQTPQAELTAPDQAGATQRIGRLRAAGFPGLAAIEFKLAASAFPPAGILEAAENAPDAESFAKWAKAAKANAKALETALLGTPERVYLTSGADWLLAVAKASKLRPFITRFWRSEPRPEHLPSPAAVVRQLLDTDPKGAWLQELLGLAAADDDGVGRLVGMIEASPKARELALFHLPPLAITPDSARGASLVIYRLFAGAPTLAGVDRLKACATLAQLEAACVLTAGGKPWPKELPDVFRRLNQELRVTASTKEAQDYTWIFESLAAEPTPAAGAPALNLNAARHVMVAIGQARRGLAGAQVLDVLARNVGLEPIGTVAERLPYDPKLHEDTVGGLLPGRSVEVLGTGWRWGRDVVLRAQVKPTE